MGNIFDQFRKGRTNEEADNVKDRGFLEVLQALPFGECPFRIPTTKEARELGNGPFPFGLVGFHRETVRVDPHQLHRNLAILGGARTGKTWLLWRLVLCLLGMNDIGVLIADLKESFLALCKIGVLVTKLKDLPWNPLEHIPGTDIESHCWEIGQQLSSAYYLQNSGTIISRTLLDTFKRSGQPTLKELRRELHRTKAGGNTGLNQNQVTAVKGRIDQLSTVLGEKICATRHGFMPHKHAHEKVVFSLNAGCPNAHAFFTTWLNYELFTYNKAHNIRPDKLNTTIVVDEANYLLVDRPDFPPYIDQLNCTQSEFGLGILAGSQLKFSQTFSANAAHQVLLSVGNAMLFKRQAEAMGLTREQIQWAQRNLGGAGNAIISTPNHGEPLLVALLPLEQTIPEYTNDDLQRSTEKLNDKIKTYAKQETPTNVPALIVQPTPSRQLEMFGGMLPHATKLLVTIAQELLPAAQAYEKAGLSASQGNSAKTFLEEQELATATQCRLYKGRGRQPVILEPTPKGLDYLKAHQPNVKPFVLSGRGGLEHRLHADLIAKHHAAQGSIIKKEHRDADLGIEDQQTGTWFAVEVVTKNEANIEDRIPKNHEAGAEKTIVICSDRKIMKRLEHRLNGQAEVQDIEAYLERRKEKQNE